LASSGCDEGDPDSGHHGDQYHEQRDNDGDVHVETSPSVPVVWPRPGRFTTRL